ncbi:unnamed protein product, partial [marine sediment metagenome]
MNIQELYDKRAQLVADMRVVLNKVEEEKRELTAEEQSQYDAIETDVDKIGAQIQRETKLVEAERRERELMQAQALQPPKQQGLDPTQLGSGGAEKSRRQESREWIKGWSQQENEYVSTNPQVFEQRAATDPQSLTDAAGGYTVADEFLRQLHEARLESNIMRGLANVILSTSGTLTVPQVNTHGVAAWYDEEEIIVVAQDTFTRKQYSAYKAGRIMTVTNELMNDSMFDLASYCAGELGRSIGVLEEASFVAGDGSSKPTGIFTGATTGVTAASATAVTTDEILELFHSVIAAYRVAAGWIVKDSTALLVRKLKDG